MKKIYASIVLFVFIATSIACAETYTSADSMPPTKDTRLEQMVEEIVIAGMTQTIEAIPPTATNTSTATPTASPTATRTPLPIGSLLIPQEDGSAIFIDERAGFLIHISQGWLNVRAREEEFYRTLADSTLAPIHSAVSKIYEEDTSRLRLLSVDVKNLAAQNRSAGMIRFEWDESRVSSPQTEEELDALITQILDEVPTLEITSANLVRTPKQITLAVIESRTRDAFFQKRIYFKTQSGVVLALLHVEEENARLEIIPEFDAMMDSIQITGQ